MKMDARAREIYLEGLKRYQERGVRILLDGKEADASQWGTIFEVREDGSFYMGDYVLEDETEEKTVCERPAEYGEARLCGKRLKEIRFDRVYNR